LVEDERGFIYIGSAVGLFVKAGVQWAYLRTETLPSENVTSIICDSTGNVWVGTAGGIARFNGEGWESFNKKQGMAGNNVRQMCLDLTGRIWAFIYGNIGLQGMACYDGEEWTSYIPGKDLPEGNIISDLHDFAQTNAILTRSGFAWFNGRKWTVPGKEQGLEGNRFYFFKPDGSGHFWVASDLGLFRGDGEHFEKVFPPQSGTWGVVSMVCDSQRRVWVVTDDRTVYLTENDITTVFSQTDGLPDEEIKEIIEDQAGRIWMLCRKGAALYQF
jgi:ligand-binding sensor domain-containing protein